jgi:phosphoglycolate phosphatase-like HAD superfamily hydrolase
MNSQSHIKQTLAENKISDLFQFVVGYEEVDMRKQKPEPDGLLLCLEKLTGLASGYVFYIGDHETDVKCAANANRVLRDRKPEVKIITIAALYGSEKSGNNSLEGDYCANQAEEITDIIKHFQI